MNNKEKLNSPILNNSDDRIEKIYKSGETQDPNIARRMIEIEDREMLERTETKQWIKKTIKSWHDIAKPDYIFHTETGATPYGFALKEAWKNAYPEEKTPTFYRIDPRVYSLTLEQWKEEIGKYFSKRIKKDNPRIIIHDEGGVGVSRGIHQITENGVLIDEDYGDNKHSSGTLSDAVQDVINGLEKINQKSTIFITEEGGGETLFNGMIDNNNTECISRRPTSRVFGTKSSRTASSEDELLLKYGGLSREEMLKELYEKGKDPFTGRTIKHPEQRKRAIAWIQKLKEIGEESGKELKEEIK